jgi:arsenate reductase
MTADKPIIYHNPGCSKSREALQIIVQNNKNPEIIEYLNKPPGQEELKLVIKLLGISARGLLRTNEQAYIDAKLDDSATEEQIIESICTYPILLQRPIVISGNRAVIGRPPSKVLEII